MAYIFPQKIYQTTLNHYLQCPFKFKCHNDKEIKAKFIEGPETFVGKIMHMVLKDLFDINETPINERKKQDLGKMLKHSWARVPKNGWSKEYWSAEERIKLFGSKEQEKAFGLKAITMLSNYISGADLSVIPLSLEDWMECSLGEFTLSGCIDRIDQNSSTAISVWDYKTGRLPYHSSIEKMMAEDLQVPIYAIISSKLNPFAKKIRAGLIYVKYSRVYDVIWTKEDLKHIENRIIGEIKKAQNENDFQPKINALCPWCEYKEICPDKDKIKEKYAKIDEVSW